VLPFEHFPFWKVNTLVDPQLSLRFDAAPFSGIFAFYLRGKLKERAFRTEGAQVTLPSAKLKLFVFQRSLT
jgi:hypothetical protein